MYGQYDAELTNLKTTDEEYEHEFVTTEAEVYKGYLLWQKQREQKLQASSLGQETPRFEDGTKTSFTETEI